MNANDRIIDLTESQKASYFASWLYINGFTTDAENKKICERIKDAFYDESEANND